jgi:acetylglutamate kinase
MASPLTSGEISKTIIEALPYIRKLYGKTIVVKFGGNVSSSPEKLENVAKDIVLLKLVGMEPVVVHGGGDEISRFMQRVDKEAEFVDGLRITDDETMEIVEMVLVGKVNKLIVGSLERQGGKSVGLSGKDGKLIIARVKDPKLGRVGVVDEVNTKVVDDLSKAGFIPVIAPVGMDEDGGSLNINADTMAGELAIELRAEKYILLSDVMGIMRDPGEPNSLISSLSISEARKLIEEKIVTGGMLPKLESCISAIERGVGRGHILNGDIPHSLVLELLTDKGIGTMISGQ